MRQFRDAAGLEWRVYQTERNAAAEQRRDHLLPSEYLEGWLVFEAATEKRRLAPVPPGWSDLADEALAALCSSATLQTRGTKRSEQPLIADVAAPRRDEHGASSESGEAALHAIEVELTETLEDVCDAPPVEKLDTGELIRVEETLAIAAETAKEAVSLRRKRRIQAVENEQRPTRVPGGPHGSLGTGRLRRGDLPGEEEPPSLGTRTSE